MKKIAFCFLIFDIINHEELWYFFFKNIDKNKYNIYIHYKINKPLKHLDNYKLNNCTKTLWGDISLVFAQNILLEEAFKDKDNTNFIFISNSCVPLKSFNYIYDFLKDDFSYFSITKKEQCFPRCDKSLRFIDYKYIQKASQWCILNRTHTKLMLENIDYIHWFNYKGTIPDEHCYITKIFHSGLEKEIINCNNLESTTFTNWPGTDYKYVSKKALKNYDKISEEELKCLINSKCLFGRKFKPECAPYLFNSIKSIIYNPDHFM